MNLKINDKTCIGCGICQSLCPNCFSIDSGIAKIISTDYKNCKLEEIVENCPIQAISIKED